MSHLRPRASGDIRPGRHPGPAPAPVGPAVVRLLLDRGLLTPADLTGCSLTVREQRSGTKVHVRVEGVPRPLFVKAFGTLGERPPPEAEVHELVRAGVLRLDGVAPTCLASDESAGAIVFPLVDAVPLWSTATPDAGTVAPGVARNIGHAVAWVHRTAWRGRGDRLAPAATPWELLLSPGGATGPFRATPTLEPAFAVARRPAVRTALEWLRDTWTTEAFVHGDLRSANLLVPPAETSAGAPRHGVWLVDWECAGSGDPAWDVGGVLQDLLHLAVTTAVDGTARGGDLGRRCATAVRAQQPAFGAFWHAYHQGSHGSVHPVRAVAMAGARLLQTCVEGAVAGPAPSLEPLLQASARLLTEPDAAAREVFGL